MKTLIIALTGILLTLGTQAADRSMADTRVKPGDVTRGTSDIRGADGTNWLVGDARSTNSTSPAQSN